MPPRKKVPIPISSNVEVRKEDLPHLYSWPWYSWAWDFFNDTSKNAFLVAPNQVSKSSTLIRKVIHWATCPELWPKLWPTKPTQFWYFYPSKDVATVEFDEKWEKEFMPRGAAKDHPIYGWHKNMKFGSIHDIRFNSGISIYFKSYEQSAGNVQTSSVYFLACDEELPVSYWPEISARRDGMLVDGYFNMTFTATLSQRFWYETIECRGLPNERFPDAKKIQISLYDCQQYMDGTKTGWTNERIQKRIDSCQSEKEVLRRVMGRFVNEELSIISGFSEEQNYKHGEFIVPSTWSRIISFYVSSVGTGICVLAVSAEFDKVVVAECHKLDLTSYEALEKLHVLRGKKSAELYINAEPLDFIEMSQNSGIFFQTVKNPKNGLKDKINSYFKTGVLEIAKSKNSHELIMQIRTIKESDVKSYEGYEVYGAMAIGLSKLAVSLQNSIEGVKKKVPPKILNEREAFYRGLDRPLEVVDSYDNEFDEMNELLELF